MSNLPSFSLSPLCRQGGEDTGRARYANLTPSNSDYIAALDGYTVIPGGWLNHHWVQLGYQLAASLAAGTYAFGGTSIILLAMNYIPGLKLRSDEEEEVLGMDEVQLGEFAYDYVEVTRDVDLSGVGNGGGAAWSSEPGPSGVVVPPAGGGVPGNGWGHAAGGGIGPGMMVNTSIGGAGTGTTKVALRDGQPKRIVPVHSPLQQQHTALPSQQVGQAIGSVPEVGEEKQC